MEGYENTDDPSVETSTESVSPEAPASTPEIPELGERFRFADKEWSRDDFKNHYDRLVNTRKNLEADYTKKSQDVATSSKYYNNAPADIVKVLSNPKLEAEFKRIYPKAYHGVLEQYLAAQKSKPQVASNEQPNQEKPALSPEMMKEWEEMKAWRAQSERQRREEATKSAEAEINNIMSSMTEKYPIVKNGWVQNVIFNNASALIDSHVKEHGENTDFTITPDMWEKLCKQAQDDFGKLADEHYKTKVDKQTKASAKAKEGGVGGGIPTQAPKKMNLKEAMKDVYAKLDAGEL